MNAAHVLKLDITGSPERWITPKMAASHYVAGEVVWTLGEEIVCLRGGINRISGLRSRQAVHAIIAVRGASAVNLLERRPTLSSRKLFARDRQTCAYCGIVLPTSQLTRDHILPAARGGADTWMNVVACCFDCNQKKRCRTPEEAGMPLLYMPYVPSHWEDLLLEGRAIKADQMAFLSAKLPRHSRLRLD